MPADLQWGGKAGLSREESSPSTFPVLPPTPGSSTFCLWVCLFWTFPVKGLIGSVVFGDWLLSLS